MTVEKQVATEEKILRAAEAEFIQHGYHGSRMQSIAERAEINKAMLHYYFRSKDQLFERIFQEKAQDFFPKVNVIFQTDAPFITKLEYFIDDYMALLLANPYLPFYMISVSSTNAEMFERVKLDFPIHFVAAFEKASTQGEIRQHHPMQFMMSVMGMCVMPFLSKHIICKVFKKDDEAFFNLMHLRATEIKTYFRLILTPELSKS